MARTDGAIRTLIDGVSTRDPSVQKKSHIQEQNNFRSSKLEGLTRRPPMDFIEGITPVAYYDSEADSVHYTEIDGKGYFYLIQPSRREVYPGFNILTVFDLEGNTYPTSTSEELDYLDSTTTAPDYAFASKGDITFVVNREVPVAMSIDVKTNVETTLLHCKNTLPASAGVTLAFFDGVDGFGDPVTRTVVYTPASVLTVVDTATQIAAACNAVATTVTVVSNEAVVMFTPDEANPLHTPGYVWLNVESSEPNATIPINGKIQDLADLPASAPENEIIEVETSTTDETSNYYLRAERSSIADVTLAPLPPASFITNAGRNVSFGTTYTGFLGGVGSTSPAIYLYEGLYEVDACVVSSNPAQAGGPHILSVSLTTDVGGVPTPITHVLMVDNVTGAQVINATTTWDVGMRNATVAVSGSLIEGRSYTTYFNSDVVVVVPPDSGELLNNVIWVEETKPHEEFRVDPSTMPVAIIHTDGEFHLTTLSGDDVTSWTDRGAGNNKSNPPLGFVGNRISDISIFQGRLVLASSNGVYASETDNLFNFWKDSALQTVASDPIGIESTANEGTPMDYFVEHNDSLLVFNRTGQFTLPAGVALTPQTAALPRTSTYAFNSKCIPISDGIAVYFPFTYGNTSGVNKLDVAFGRDRTSEAVTLTDEVSKYIEGNVTQMVADSNLNIVIAYCGESANNVLYVHEYELGETGYTAWSKWELPDDLLIGYIRIVDATVYVVAQQTRIGGAEQIVTLHSIDLETLRTSTSTNVHVDSKAIYTNAGIAKELNTRYSAEVDDLIAVQGEGCPDEGAVLGFERSGRTMTWDEDMGAGTVIVGLPYESSIILPKVSIRDESGRVQSGSKVRILRWLIHLVESGAMTAEILSDYYNYPLFEYYGMVGNSITSEYDSANINTDMVSIPFKQDPQLADMRLSTSSWTPLTISNIEWFGAYNKRGRRF